MEVEKAFIHDSLLARTSLFNQKASYLDGEAREKRDEKKVSRSSHKPSTTSRLKSQPRRLIHCTPEVTVDHSGTSTTRKNDHHYPISLGNLIPSGLNCVPYWNIECLEGVFVVTDPPGVPIPSTRRLFLTNSVSPGRSPSDWSEIGKLGKVGPGRVSAWSAVTCGVGWR